MQATNVALLDVLDDVQEGDRVMIEKDSQEVPVVCTESDANKERLISFSFEFETFDDLLLGLGLFPGPKLAQDVRKIANRGEASEDEILEKHRVEFWVEEARRSLEKSIDLHWVNGPRSSGDMYPVDGLSIA